MLVERLTTVVTVIRDEDRSTLARVAEQVRYLALETGGFESTQWLVAIDGLSPRPEQVLRWLDGHPVRHEAWVNCTGVRGDDAAREFVFGFADGRFVLFLDGDEAVSVGDLAGEILLAQHEADGLPSEPPAAQ